LLDEVRNLGTWVPVRGQSGDVAAVEVWTIVDEYGAGAEQADGGAVGRGRLGRRERERRRSGGRRGLRRSSLLW